MFCHLLLRDVVMRNGWWACRSLFGFRGNFKRCRHNLIPLCSRAHPPIFSLSSAVVGAYCLGYRRVCKVSHSPRIANTFAHNPLTNAWKGRKHSLNFWLTITAGNFAVSFLRNISTFPKTLTSIIFIRKFAKQQ